MSKYEVIYRILDRIGPIAVLVAALVIGGACFLGYSYAEQGTQVNFVWGLMSFTKHRAGAVEQDTSVRPRPALSCPYQISADEGTIRRLIEAESEAANAGDVSIISKIFAPDATIRNASNGDESNDPIARYTALFQTLTYSGAINYDIRRVSMNDTAAVFASASKGYYREKKARSQSEYNNPPGSNEWVFKRGSTGCWVICRFTFNKSTK